MHLPTWIIINIAVAFLFLLVTIGLAFFAFRLSGSQKLLLVRRAIVLSMIALAIAYIGATKLRLQYDHRISRSYTLVGKGPTTETSSWHIDTRWGFIGTALLDIGALVIALRAYSRLSSAKMPVESGR